MYELLFIINHTFRFINTFIKKSDFNIDYFIKKYYFNFCNIRTLNNFIIYEFVKNYMQRTVCPFCLCKPLLVAYVW